MESEQARKRRLLRRKLWGLKNREYRLKYMKDLYEKNPSYRLKRTLYLRNRKRTKPWLSHYDCARTRCLNKNVKCFHRYGNRGIKFCITAEDIRKIWFRDSAKKMTKPTLDRINNDGHYEYSNCRFIEKSLNSSKGNYEARWKK